MLGLRSTAKWTLFLLTLINLFNYLDRFILSALLPAIKRDTGWSDSRLGFLATAFMFMYFLVSPIFGWLGDYKARNRVMAAGVAIWSFAAAASGLARGYAVLLLARLFVGVGEASYATITPALISDLYPKSGRGKIFSIFFMAIPVGAALGYLLGGVLEHHFGWRHAFLFTGLPGIFLAIALLFVPDPPRGRFDTEKLEKISQRSTYAKLRENQSYIFTVLGYAAYTFVVGGVAVWIPSYMERYLGVTAAKGNVVFGAITVVAGFGGTLCGGAIADAWAKRSGDAYLKLSALSMLIVFPIYFFVMRTNSFVGFSILLFILEFFLFLSTSPINAQIVNSVPSIMRATANALAIFVIHLFGDVISPPLVGFISDHSELKVGMDIFFLPILAAFFLWGFKVVYFFEVLPWPESALKLPKSQCHRGYRLPGVQENTLEAFRLAKANGATMIELDVRLSKDGIPVVMHDADILRVSGNKGIVSELDALDLKKMGNAPSLLDVLTDSAVPAFINIEIKSEMAASDGLEAAVAKVVKLSEAEGRVLFSSFNPLVLRRLAKILPNVPRALLVTNEDSDKNKFYLKKMLLAFLARPHILHLDQKMYSPQMANNLRSRSIPAAVWTVEKAETAKKLLALGAESIISDDPRVLG